MTPTTKVETDPVPTQPKSWLELYPLELTTLKDEELPELRRVASEATLGEWKWFGNTDSKQFYLATQHAGRRFVMLFARYGMQNAQPVFQDLERHVMVKARDLVEYEVCPEAGPDAKDRRVYRRDIGRINHPDAIFMEQFSPYNALRLLNKIDELQDRIKELEAPDPDPV